MTERITDEFESDQIVALQSERDRLLNKYDKAKTRIAELEAEIKAWVLYSEAVAEICDENTFQNIETEFILRKKVAGGLPE